MRKQLPLLSIVFLSFIASCGSGDDDGRNGDCAIARVTTTATGSVFSTAFTSGETVDYSYDPNGNVSRIETDFIVNRSDATQSIGHVVWTAIYDDDAFQLSTRREATSGVLLETVSFTYENERLVREDWNQDGSEHVITYEYNSDDKLVKIVHSGGLIREITYTGKYPSKITRLSGTVRVLSEFEFNSHGYMTKRITNEEYINVTHESIYSYYDNGQLKRGEFSTDGELQVITEWLYDNRPNPLFKVRGNPKGYPEYYYIFSIGQNFRYNATRRTEAFPFPVGDSPYATETNSTYTYNTSGFPTASNSVMFNYYDNTETNVAIHYEYTDCI